MNFTSHVVPVKFYSDLTMAQFNTIEKNNDIFYQVNDVGLYKGSTLIASVGNNEDLTSYVNTQINNLRNQFNATVQGDGTVLLTIKGQSFTLATPSSIGGGSVIEPTITRRSIGDPSISSWANYIAVNLSKQDGEDLYQYIAPQLSENEGQDERGYARSVYFDGGWAAVYYCSEMSVADSRYNEHFQNGYSYLAQSGKFVYIEYRTNSQPQEEGVVIINNPLNVQTEVDKNGATTYIITTQSQPQTPSIHWNSQSSLSLEAGTSNTIVRAEIQNNTYGFEVRYSSSDELVVTVDSSGLLTGVGEGTATVSAYMWDKANSKQYDDPITCTVTVTPALPKFNIVGMSGPIGSPGSMPFYAGQTWAQYIENYPNNGASAYFAPYLSIDENTGKILYNMGEEEKSALLQNGITQQQLNNILPFELLYVNGTSPILEKDYWFKSPTNELVADNSELGENEINFTIDGKTFKATQGMTFADWIDSKYNCGFIVKEGYNYPLIKQFANSPYTVITQNGFYFCILQLDVIQTLSREIASNGVYELAFFLPAAMIDPYLSCNGGYQNNNYIGDTEHYLTYSFNNWPDGTETPAANTLKATSSNTSVATINRIEKTPYNSYYVYFNCVGEGTSWITLSGNGYEAVYLISVNAATNYGTSENPITPEEAQLLVNSENTQASEVAYVYGKVSSVSFNSQGNYVIRVGNNGEVQATITKEDGIVIEQGDYIGISGIIKYTPGKDYVRMISPVTVFSTSQSEQSGSEWSTSSTGVNWNVNNKYLQPAGTLQLSPQFEIKGTMNGESVTYNSLSQLNYVWSSSNEAVATVSQSGLVTAVATGNVTITLSFPDLDMHGNVVNFSTNLVVDERDVRAAYFTAMGERINFIQGQTFTQWINAAEFTNLNGAGTFVVNDNKVCLMMQTGPETYTYMEVLNASPNDTMNDYTVYSFALESIAFMGLSYSADETKAGFFVGDTFINSYNGKVHVNGEGDIFQTDSDGYVIYIAAMMGNHALYLVDSSMNKVDVTTDVIENGVYHLVSME